VDQVSEQRVYLIDEDEAVRDSLKVLLESHGTVVEDFSTAEAFLARCRPAQNGCLVLGHNRLILDGLELMVELRRRGIGLPVIFIVGGGDDMSRAAALAAGAFAYLARPVEETTLLRTVQAALTPPSARRMASS
jgi:FixJ family two-component response regulator